MPERINVCDFDLAGTLECGQAFRWQRAPDGWFTGVVARRLRRVRQVGDALEGDVDPHYFALDVPLAKVVATFPGDDVLQEAVKKHWGLRVLRQEPWETLASFIASSTKQIVQIRQIVAALAQRFGVNEDFPSVDVIARASLPELKACKLGFRAKYLLAAAQAIDRGEVRLDKLPAMEYDRALKELTKLEGVGEKIANCTLLFSCGHNEAFPVDVHVKRSLQRLFPGRTLTAQQIRSHFGPYAGWAQQYLFFQQRARGRQSLLDTGAE
jgi:N-glycosylase/DNA lyase